MNPSGLTPCDWTGVREQGTKTDGLDDAGELSNALPDWGRLIVLAADTAHAASSISGFNCNPATLRYKKGGDITPAAPLN